MTGRPQFRAAAVAAGGASLWLLLVAQTAVPVGWHRIGGRTGYEIRVDPSGGRGGSACVLLHGSDPPKETFTGVSQSVDATPWRGQRLSVSAWIRSEGMDDWGGLYVRVDDVSGKRLAFGNNRKLPVRGTTGWRRYQVVLDVPKNAKTLSFGVHLNGNGSLWADDFSLEQVARR